jgi:hypothetical protein
VNSLDKSSFSTAYSAAHTCALDALQTRFALRVTAGLTERTQELDADIVERLRHSRETALARARNVCIEAPQTLHFTLMNSTTALLGMGGRISWFGKLVSVAPAIVLMVGLVCIQSWHTQTQIEVAADIDAAILADDLPPEAYSDIGFAEFLKNPTE